MFKTLLLKVILSFLSFLDIILNKIFNGRYETVSCRAGRARDSKRIWGESLCWVLDKLDPGHCDRAKNNPLGGLN